MDEFAQLNKFVAFIFLFGAHCGTFVDNPVDFTMTSSPPLLLCSHVLLDA